jgi:hypothetical protein
MRSILRCSSCRSIGIAEPTGILSTIIGEILQSRIAVVLCDEALTVDESLTVREESVQVAGVPFPS